MQIFGIWILGVAIMCGKNELFSTLDELKDQVAIKLKYGSRNFIFDIFYAPGLHHNLLSMRQLLEKGCNMKIHHAYYILIDKNEIFIVKGEKAIEIVHSDICIVEMPTHGDNKYFITFIDDFSRKTWMYFSK
ncbi:hypothetical protein CR513_46259, partial [Mucuna pruriens]